MTRDELIENIIATIIKNPPTTTRVRDAGFLEYTERVDHSPTAAAVADTIFAALREPTEEMILSGGEYVLSVGSIDCMHADDRPEFGIKGRETGSYELFKAMLSASPLAPKEK